MRKARLSLLAGTVLTACAPQPIAYAPPRATQSLPVAMLAVHNAERRAFGSPPVAWDPAIAAQASRYARALAQLGQLQHSPRAVRPGQGENLWRGTRGAFAMSAMADGWVAERRYFRPGRFPAVSATRNWASVGHFTQMIWPATSRIGCGLAAAGRWDVLVCRYAPGGNVDGVALAPR